VHIRSLSLRLAGLAALAGLWLSGSGCYLDREARFDIIEREAAKAEARAEATLKADEAACDGDPDCLRIAGDRYAAAMREIQATRDARVDAELARDRGR
jgi:hypothetical protein